MGRRKAGWSVAVIDHLPFGGTCALRGCDLGAHLIGPDAAEVINLFGFAMRNGPTAGALRHATFAYPAAASDLESMLPRKQP